MLDASVSQLVGLENTLVNLIYLIKGVRTFLVLIDIDYLALELATPSYELLENTVLII
jgi:hypothetical protein